MEDSIRLKIQGNEVRKYPLNNGCVWPEETSIEFVKLSGTCSKIVIEFEGIGITVPKEDAIKIFNFLIDDQDSSSVLDNINFRVEQLESVVQP